MTETRTTLVGVFNTHEAAQRAVAELRSVGFSEDSIGLVGRNHLADADDNVIEGAGSGAAIGAVAGAGTLLLGSLAVSLGVIPVIGPILAIGPLAAALISGTGGALAGAATGGLVGALVGWGVSEDEAAFYESEVRNGRYLVTVESSPGDDARDILSRHGGRVRESTSRS